MIWIVIYLILAETANGNTGSFEACQVLNINIRRA